MNRLRYALPLGWAVLIYWFSDQPRWVVTVPPWPGIDKVLHAAVFGILVLLGLWARRARSGREALCLLLLGCAYGALDEWHQSFVPGRSADIWDVLADVLGCVVATALWWKFYLSSQHRA